MNSVFTKEEYGEDVRSLLWTIVIGGIFLAASVSTSLSILLDYYYPPKQYSNISDDKLDLDAEESPPESESTPENENDSAPEYDSQTEMDAHNCSGHPVSANNNHVLESCAALGCTQTPCIFTEEELHKQYNTSESDDDLTVLGMSDQEES